LRALSYTTLDKLRAVFFIFNMLNTLPLPAISLELRRALVVCMQSIPYTMYHWTL